MAVGQGYRVVGIDADGDVAADSAANFLASASGLEMAEWIRELLAWPDVRRVEVRSCMVEVEL
jgi:hypothetical protein